MSSAKIGSKVKLELEVLVKGNDAKGLSGVIEPDSVVPDGFEKVDPDAVPPTTTAPEPSSAMATAPVTQAMNLRKKGGG